MKKSFAFALVLSIFLSSSLWVQAQSSGRPNPPPPPPSPIPVECSNTPGGPMSMNVTSHSMTPTFTFTISSNIGASIDVTTDGTIVTEYGDQYVITFPITPNTVSEYSVDCSDSQGNREGCIIVIDPALYDTEL